MARRRKSTKRRSRRRMGAIGKKAKGTAAETAVVKYLKGTWDGVERRALAGSADKGDISGIPNVCIEVKDHKKMVLSGWIKELDEEMRERLNNRSPLKAKENFIKEEASKTRTL